MRKEREYDAANSSKPRKGRAGCLIVLILLAVLLIVGGLAGAKIIGEIGGADITGSPVIVTVEQGSGPATIGNVLKEAGVIKYPKIFRLYVKQQGAAGSLQYGEFTVEPGMPYDQIIEILSTTVKRPTTTVTFPEGITAIQFAQRMEEAGLCTVQEFLDVANNGDFSQYDFWNQIPEDPEHRFMKCEGYLAPNTYEFYNDDTVYNYVDKLYAQFNSEITPELTARMEELDMTLDETIILASFVQEEAGNAESARVSAVFHNRLAPDSPFPRLESNVSSYVQNPDDNNYIYNWIAPYYGGWDQIPASIYSSYNTYELAGLPAGPVSNPGAEAIRATLYPDEEYLSGKYYFFVTDKNGKYYYGKTVSEHAANCNVAFSVK